MKYINDEKDEANIKQNENIEDSKLNQDLEKIKKDIKNILEA